MCALSSWLIFCAKPRKEITGINSMYNTIAIISARISFCTFQVIDTPYNMSLHRLLGAWNSDGNIRRRVSSLDFKRRSALQIFGDGFRFRFLFFRYPVFWKLSFEVISVSEYRTCRNGFLRIC
ncbi:unnamed protein product [Rhizophagus irregularis]|nr:unnamed protein product [Rhizophagus irregularis]